MSVKDASSGTVKTYYYEKNLQGDIVGIMNEAGYKVVSYTYDAWGNPYEPVYSYNSGVSATDRANAELNPFRYRGYYYDVETGYYYLQTRYYNPEWGRFLNADSALYGNMLGFNLFAYCYNNPVNYFDPTGESGIAAVLAGWASSAWGLMLVDGLLPVGDIIYVGGIIILSIVVVVDTAILAEKVADLVQEATEDSTDGATDNTDTSVPKVNDKDKRLVGKPGDINKEGYRESKIGKDGRATSERHNSDHGDPKHHSNPHDHDITWDPNVKPHFGPPKNYWGKSIPIFK